MRYKIQKSLIMATVLGAMAGQTQAADVFYPGFLKWESWVQDAEGNPPELTGANLDDASVLPAIPSFGAPTDTFLIPSFNSRGAYPTDAHDNYLARITGVIIPKETGDYHFYLRSDDDGRLYLNKTGETPPDVTSGTEVPIAKEDLDCCDGFINPGKDTDGDGFGDANLDDTPNTDAEATTVTPIHLEAGKKYGITALLKEGGGGDFLEVAMRKASDTTTTLAPITGDLLGTMAAPLAITTQPSNATGPENVPLTLSVGVNITGGANYQWQADGVNIAGATNATFRIAPVIANNSKKYHVVVGAAAGQSVTSSDVTVTATADTTAPSIVSSSSFLDRNGILVTFSEPLVASAMTTAGNYALNNGATVSSVEQVSDRSVFVHTSVLNASASYTLTASNLKDLSAAGGNVLTPNTSTFTTPAGAPAGQTQLNLAHYQRWGADEGVSSFDTLEDAIVNGTAAGVDTLVATFEAPADIADSYGARVQGYFIPPTSGNYVFFGNSDDNGRFYLSTDSDPANKKLIAQETAWSATRQWSVSGGGSDLNAKRSDRFSATEWPDGNKVTLIGGQKYYMELRFVEGGGGDNGGMTYKLEGAPDPVAGDVSRITGTNVAWYADLSQAAPIVTKMPTGKTFNKGDTIVLEGDANGKTPLAYQWFHNKSPIAGATSKTLTISNADYNAIGDYNLHISNSVGEVDTNPRSADDSARLLMSNAYVIEAEDYNYEGGKTVAAASTMPYAGNAYAGLKPTLDIDFFNSGDEAAGDAGAFAYNRHAVSDTGVVEIKGGGDAVNNAAGRNRGSFSVTANYAVGWGSDGDWQNYTRTIPAGKYVVFAGVAQDGAPDPADPTMVSSLSTVASPKTADNSAVGVEGGGQTLTKLGTFKSAKSGAWSSNDIIPLTDDTGKVVEVQLGGEQTLRWTNNSGQDSDFLLLYCLDCAGVPPAGPAISIARNATGSPVVTFEGTLQRATAVDGPYTPVAGATSPYTAPTTDKAAFFRAAQ